MTAQLLALSVLKASIVLALAQLVVAVAPRLSAAARHLLLTAGIASFLIVPLLALAGPAWSVAIPAAPIASAPATVQEVVFTGAVPVSDSALPVRRAPDLAAIAVTLWLLVALALVVRLGRSAIRLRAILASAVEPSARLRGLLDDVRERLGVDVPVRILRSDRVHVPMVWGVRAGTLLLPEAAEEWTAEHLRATFIHELGHLQRLDYVSLGLMNVVSALLWFHPQVWVARRRALAEGERACDDLVLRAGERASEYASHLLHVARSMPRREPLAALLAMSRPSQLEGRMSAILSPSTNRQAVGGKRLMLSIASFLAVVVPLAAMQVAPPPPPPAPVKAAAPAPVPPPAPAALTAPAPPAPMTAPPPPVAPLKRGARTRIAVPVAPPLPPSPADAAQPAHPATPPAPAAPFAAPRPPMPAEVPEPPPAGEPVPAAAPAPPPPPPAAPEPPTVRLFSSTDLTTLSYRTIAPVSGRACTIKLNRPTNTGDPSRNPAEALATRRLLADAAAKGANGVTNLTCMREIAIGTGCPTAVVCEASAISVGRR